MKFFDRLKQIEFIPKGKMRKLATSNSQKPFFGYGKCDVENCDARALVLLADDNKKAFTLCTEHAEQATASA